MANGNGTTKKILFICAVIGTLLALGKLLWATSRQNERLDTMCETVQTIPPQMTALATKCEVRDDGQDKKDGVHDKDIAVLQNQTTSILDGINEIKGKIDNLHD